MGDDMVTCITPEMTSMNASAVVIAGGMYVFMITYMYVARYVYGYS